MSKPVALFQNQNFTDTIFLKDFTTTLPFPLYLPYFVKVAIALGLVLILIVGLRSRTIIFQFICHQNTNANPINKLTFTHLISGTVFGSINLIFAIAAILMAEPLSSILTENSCYLNKAAASFSIHGSYIWTCLIAICRILYIKAQNWIKYKMGEENMFALLLFVGLSIQTVLSLFVPYFDTSGIFWKLCTHHSQEDMNAIDDYMVSQVGIKESWNILVFFSGQFSKN